MVFGGACDVNSSSPPPLTLHSGIFRPPPDIPPPLLILLCWTIRLPFIFNQWRQFWVKSRVINIKNYAFEFPFRIPRSSKYKLSHIRGYFVTNSIVRLHVNLWRIWLFRTFIILEVLRILIYDECPDNFLFKRFWLIKSKSSPLGSASDFYILNIQWLKSPRWFMAVLLKTKFNLEKYFETLTWE